MSSGIPRSNAQTATIDIRRVATRQLVPLAVVLVAVWLLRERIATLDLSAIWATLDQVTARQWLMSVGATAVSFWAVGRYDKVLHGILATNVSGRHARYSGTAAIAIAQFAGFGVLTGALVRWRLLPDLSLGRALRISLAVSASFLAGWAVISAVAVLLAGDGLAQMRKPAIAVLLIAALLLPLSVWQPRLLGRLPSLRAIGAIMMLVLADTVFAGLALYVLLPAGFTPDVVTFFAVFLVSLGIGLIGGTPGGIGPFEVALLALLPGLPDEPLLASALAFRLVYHALPAALATVMLISGPLRKSASGAPLLAPPRRAPYLPPYLERLMWSAPRAEVNLIRQGEFGLVTSHGLPLALAAPLGQSLVMLADPLGPRHATGGALRVLGRVACATHRDPVLYKCSARTAVAARRMGWQVLPIANEAWLRPQAFGTQGSDYRQLRRHLRKAHSAGVQVVEGGRKLPLAEMRRVADIWAARHHGERGFSMGRYDADYVSCQRVFLACQNGALIGFITMHEVQNEWTLDLMRQIPDAPDGTMHLLIQRAIESAAALKCPRLSLAAVPYDGADATPLVARLRARAGATTHDRGLRRFKNSFAPDWQVLYVAAPGRLALIVGLWDIWRRVNRRTRGRRHTAAR